MSLTGLVDRWRDDAVTFRRWGQEAQAVAIERAADDLEAHLRNAAHDTVTLREAAALGGYRYDSLSEMVRDGRLENMGEKGKPRIRRMDVPVKPGCGGQAESVPVLRTENGGRGGLEEAVEHRGVRIHRGGDAP